MRSLALILILTSTAAAQVSAPASAVTSADWQTRIAIADKLLDAGYVDAAQNDYESIIQDLPAASPGVDRAWWGLARVHLAQGDTSSAKTAMEEVLTRNNDASSVNGCKALYRQLKATADAAVQQAQMSVNYFQYMYDSVPWYDLFTKIFTYLDLRKANKNLAQVQAYDDTFDPHYLIDLPTIAGAGGSAAASATLSESDFAAIVAGNAASAAVHTPAPGSQTTTSTASTTASTSSAPASVVSPPPPATASTQTIGTGTTPASTPASTPAATTQASQTTAASSTASTPADLASLQRNYQEAYRNLTAAMSSGDQSAVIQANAAYQKALAAYRDAASKLTAGH